MSGQLQHTGVASKNAHLETEPSEKTNSSSSKIASMTSSTAQKRDHPGDPADAPSLVKRGRGRPRKHPIINKNSIPLFAAPKPKPPLFKETLEPPRKKPCAGKRRSRRIQEIQEREEEEEMAANEISIPLYKPPTRNKLWDMQQTRILLVHDPTETPPPHHGHFGDTLGFDGGNYSYQQNKRIYEARCELAETADFEVIESLDTDIEVEDDEKAVNAYNAHNAVKDEEEDKTLKFEEDERWSPD